MLNTNPPSGRMYGLMQALIREYAQKRVPPAAEPRGIVTDQDALDAVLNLASFLDKNLQEGDLSQNDAAHMAAMLMLIREYIRPLPEGLAVAEGEAAGRVTRDLRIFVDGLRTARENTGMKG